MKLSIHNTAKVEHSWGLGLAELDKNLKCIVFNLDLLNISL